MLRLRVDLPAVNMLRRLRIWISLSAAVPITAGDHDRQEQQVVLNLRGSMDTVHFLGRLFRTLKEVLPIGSRQDEAQAERRFVPQKREDERRSRLPRRALFSEASRPQESVRDKHEEAPCPSSTTKRSQSCLRRRSRSCSSQRRRRSKTRPSLSPRKQQSPSKRPGKGSKNILTESKKKVENALATNQWNQSAKVLFDIASAYLIGVNNQNYFAHPDLADDPHLQHLAYLCSHPALATPTWGMATAVRWTCSVAAEMLVYADGHSRRVAQWHKRYRQLLLKDRNKRQSLA